MITRSFALPAIVYVALLAGCSSSSSNQPPPDSSVDVAVDAAVDTAVDTGADSSTTPSVVSCNNTILTTPAEGTCTVKKGSRPAMLVVATLLAPATVYENGHLLIDGTEIVCVGCDCSDHPLFDGASKIACPNGVVSPGLINLHDHLTFTEGTPTPFDDRYDHRHEWRKGQNGKRKLTTPSNVVKTANIGVLWGELRQLLAGTTSIMGAGGGDGLLRNLDSSKTEGLSGRATAPTFPLGDSSGTTRTETCDYPSLPEVAEVTSAPAWVPHVAEGNNDPANNEYLCLSGQRPDGVDVSLGNATFIHAVALTVNDAMEMAQSGTGINWSVRSNIALYGMTADVVMLKNIGVRITLGTDWTYTGSINLLRELACANYLNDNHYDKTFSAEELWRMVTSNAADGGGFGDRIGRLKAGYVADIAIYDGSEQAHYEAVTRGSVADVALVMRGGKVLYGDAAVVEQLGDSQCEAIEVCGNKRSLCLQSEIGLTMSELEAKFPTENNGEPYAPYPLFFCGTPDNEPTCVPSRPGEYDGKTGGDDTDGDGVVDGSDSCPRIFNPPRPMNDGTQPDSDGDKVGDECDPCPLDKDTTECSTKFNPDDRDGDEINNDADNCPDDPNKDQTDSDDDGVGDACDPCPQVKGVCPFLIKELRDTSLGKRPANGSKVLIENAVVTAIRTERSLGFYARQGTGAYEAIFVFTSTQPTTETGTPLKVGDVVTLVGAITTFHETDEIESPEQVQVVGSGDITPLAVTTKELQIGSVRAEELESHLVRASNVKVAAMVDAGNDDDFFISDDGNACSGDTPPCARVGDYFYDGEANDGQPAVTVGETLSAVVGVVNGFDSIHTLDVRTAADIVR